jgi:DNA-binding transcriptional LysR family regulator
MRHKVHNINVMMLATLEALYQHRSTTRAAEKLGIAQPSVSWYLKQLRALTGDALFVRTPHGLEPTEFCEGYYSRARDILEALDGWAAHRNPAFDPQKTAAQFSVVIPFFKARMLLEALSVDLMHAFPLLHANLLYMEEEEALKNLESGALDFYMGLIPAKLPKYFHSEKILETEFIVLCSDKSRLFRRGRVSRKEFTDTPHIRLASGFDPSILDQRLKQQKLLQKKCVTVPDIGSEIILLRETDFLLIIDRQDAEIFMAGNNFKILKTDFALPQLALHVVWHTRRKSDPAHAWFRTYLKEHCQAYSRGKRPDPKRFTA